MLAGTGPMPHAASVQRQPKGKAAKGKPVPQFVKDAQAELASLFPKDKLMGKVTIKDYGDLNKVLTSSSTFTAWTQSSGEIFVKDLSGIGDPDANDRPRQLLRYVLKHEAVHIGQFAKAKGPPKTWQRMLEFEQEAYKHDLAWLNASEGKALMPSDDVRKEAIDSATAALNAISTLLTATKMLSGTKREDVLYDTMIQQDLIPSGASKDPADLYKQP